jgi:hypothetical protein
MERKRRKHKVPEEEFFKLNQHYEDQCFQKFIDSYIGEFIYLLLQG